jgi:hypothetical protein
MLEILRISSILWPVCILEHRILLSENSVWVYYGRSELWCLYESKGSQSCPETSDNLE